MTETNELPAPPPSDGTLGRRLSRRLRFFSDDLMIGGLVVLALFVFMLPAIIITIPAGHMGVLWKRFGGGTVVDRVLTEGTEVIFPWDRIFIYDARLQSVEREFEVLSSDGLKIKIDVAWRYHVVPYNLGRLHQYAGPEYPETLLAPSIGARARDVMAIYKPEDIYTDHRLEIQHQISESVRYDLKHRFNTENDKTVDWVVIEDVLIKRIILPEGVQQSIVRKNEARHDVEAYALYVEKEKQESERKRVEALGIRNFQEIISGGMNESYLRWRGIEATLELARSHNAKVVIIGNNKTGGLPLISISGDSLKGDDSVRETPAQKPTKETDKTSANTTSTDNAKPEAHVAKAGKPAGKLAEKHPPSDTVAITRNTGKAGAAAQPQPQ